MMVGMTNFVFDDGGRADAGFKGEARDCVTRAVTIATGATYQETYDAINALIAAQRKSPSRDTSSARTGTAKLITNRLMASIGWTWTPTMEIGSGCMVHLRADELPSGVLIAKVSGHVVAVIDGVMHDTYDPSRGGTRCVYGYWQPSARSRGIRRIQ